MLKASKGTILRTAVLILALVNTSLQLMGWDVLPFTEQELETGITVVLNVGAGLAVWWKNNSFTDSGKEADRYLEEMKEAKREDRKYEKENKKNK